MERLTALEDIRNDLKLRFHLPVAVAGNGTFERRIARTRFARHFWQLPGYTEFESVRDALRLFYLEHHGTKDAFLYRDPQINTLSEILGYGNGVGKDFALLRTTGGYQHPVYHPDSTCVVTVGGVAVTGWSVVKINNLPVLRLAVAPANDAPVAIAGSFSFAVRFDSEFGYSLSHIGLASGMDQTALVEVFE